MSRLLQKIQGLTLGDKGFIQPSLKSELAQQKIYLQIPLRANMQEDRPKSFIKWMTSKRHLIEAVIGQLVDRLHIEKTRARDLWHGVSRFWRKLLAHTICMKINLSMNNEPLQFEKLIN